MSRILTLWKLKSTRHFSPRLSTFPRGKTSKWWEIFDSMGINEVYSCVLIWMRLRWEKVSSKREDVCFPETVARRESDCWFYSDQRIWIRANVFSVPIEWIFSFFIFRVSLFSRCRCSGRNVGSVGELCRGEISWNLQSLREKKREFNMIFCDVNEAPGKKIAAREYFTLSRNCSLNYSPRCEANNRNGVIRERVWIFTLKSQRTPSAFRRSSFIKARSARYIFNARLKYQITRTI